MNESTLIINNPFSLKQRNGRPIYTEIKRPDDRIKEIEEKGYKNESWLKDYKEFLKEGVKEIQVNHEINLGELKRIIITPNAKGYISTYFLDFIRANNIPIYWVDSRGSIDSSFIPTNFIKPSIVLKQYDAILKGKGLEISKYLIGLKFESYNDTKMLQDLKKAKDIKTILAIEANTTLKYFNKYGKNFSKEWNWMGRVGKNHRNKSATDPLNSCLNFGYSILAQRMSEVLLKRGFELSIGFMHNSEKTNVTWNMLTYDFIEPYRVWIDNTVKEMVEEKEIKPNDFIYTDDKRKMVLKDDAMKIGLDRFFDVLKPLEFKALPVIKNVEEML